MQKIYIILLLTCSLFGYSQTDPDKVHYKAKSAEIVFMDGDKIVTEKPYGKNIDIIYDKFFKSFHITFYNETGTYSAFDLYYISTNDDPNGSIRMRTNENSIMHVVNLLDEKGALMLMADEKFDGLVAYIFFEGAIKQ